MSEYEQGYRDGAADAANLKRIEHRIAAFAAIRRAAELARSLDRHAARYPTGTVPQQFADTYSALSIRRAIRAAIGSPKA